MYYVRQYLEKTAAITSKQEEAAAADIEGAREQSEYLRKIFSSKEVQDIIRFLALTKNYISLGYHRDPSDGYTAGWHLLLTGNGLEKHEDPNTVPFGPIVGRLSRNPRIEKINEAELVGYLYGSQHSWADPIAVSLHGTITKESEILASEILKKEQRESRPGWLTRFLQSF